MPKAKRLISLPYTKEEYFESNIQDWMDWFQGWVEEDKVREILTNVNREIWDELIQPLIDEKKAFFSKEVKERTAKKGKNVQR